MHRFSASAEYKVDKAFDTHDLISPAKSLRRLDGVLRSRYASDFPPAPSHAIPGNTIPSQS